MKFRQILTYILLILLFSGVIQINICADNNHCIVDENNFSRTEMDLFHTEIEKNVSTHLSLLQIIGLDNSYGNEGETIFSMVDKSLTSIIISLATGDDDGFMDIPLIQETLTSFGISPDEIVIDPYNQTDRMEAIDNYIRKFPEKDL